MAGGKIEGSKYLENGIYVVESAEELDEIVKVANSSGRKIAIKDARSIEIFDDTKQQLAAQRPSQIAVSKAELREFRKMLPSIPVNKKRDSAAEKLSAAVNKKEEALVEFKKMISKLVQLSDPQFKKAVLDSADVVDIEDFRAKPYAEKEPELELLFAGRKEHQIGRFYSLSSSTYSDLVHERMHQFVTANDRFPTEEEAIVIAGRSVIDSYHQHIATINKKVEKLCAQYQAATGQTLKVGGDDFNVVQVSIPEQHPNALEVTREIENATNEGGLKDLEVVTGLPEQFVKDAHRSDSIVFSNNGHPCNAYGQTKASKVVHQLNEFTRGNDKASFALAALMNQAVFLPVMKCSEFTAFPNYQFSGGTSANGIQPELTYSANRLEGGNVHICVEIKKNVGMISLFPHQTDLPTLEMVCQSGATQVGAENWTNRVYCEFVIDQKALDEGELKVVSHQPYAYECKFKVNVRDTCELMD